MSIWSEREFCAQRLAFFEEKLKKRYPFVTFESIGRSLLGREICAYTVGRGSRTLAAAVFHGMERVSGALLMRYLFDTALRFEQGEDVSLTAVPLVNPDGAQIALMGAGAAGEYAATVARSAPSTDRWQANARGVDLNHNFNAGFTALRKREIAGGYICPGPTRFGGGRPESEPESRALADFCRRRSFGRAVALHTQGREIYADYPEMLPESRPLCEQMQRRSGYRIAAPAAEAVGGGFKDWFSLRFGRPAFTVEIGQGTNPLPASVADSEYEPVREILDVLVDSA